ncbi:carbohydrate ABC transporter permease [Globicatella sanguinis]|uniref:carbohydrate ABC transporter permease n=1 Tax=Globicatella sanguinis TaxID=13076 RepID=UPI0025438E7E|nr:sugar ABC transporter permease [Globicatella sanguinis]MDK7630472.1 sugar ABC transporter permease [Globicatella sanguinis]WIK66209.1 sugar ABC transporter permease [Globicatella sanguinis]WKT55614.1 sugar ABC transporter permease [Globicatella sanguinis]
MQTSKISIFGKRYDKEILLTAILLVSPLIIGLTVFYFIPMLQSVYYSFTEWGRFGGSKFIGIENFKRLVQDQSVWRALKNTVTYALFTVPIGSFISILIATLLNSKIKGQGIYRVIYFLPAVTMTSAIGMIWRWMYNSQYGIINQILAMVGISGPNWLTDSNFAMISLIIVGIWASLGQSIVLYLAALQGISRAFYEAAVIDGANPFEKFFNITLPLITPTIFFNLLTSLISSLQVYDLIMLMYMKTNPALEEVQSLAYLFYQQSFVFNDKGYGAAISVVLLILTLIVTAVQFKFQDKWVHY